MRTMNSSIDLEQAPSGVAVVVVKGEHDLATADTLRDTDLACDPVGVTAWWSISTTPSSSTPPCCVC